MKLKYYLMGLGIGIFITTLVLSVGNRKETLSDEEIIARARELGMVMKDETKDSLEDVIEKSLDKSGLKSGDFAKYDNQAKEQPINTEEPVSENKDNVNEDADDKPETEETDFAEQDIKNTDTVDNKIPEVSEADQETADADNAENDEKQDKVADENNMAADGENDVTGEDEPASEDANTDAGEADHVTFTITRGMTSYDVARLLYQKGLIDDANDFDMYIIRKGKASVIRVGTYTLPKNASYQEILKAIT